MKNCRELIWAVPALLMLGTVLGMTAGKESYRRAQCQSNLRDLFRAEQQYEAEQGSIPPLYIAQRPKWIFWHSFIAPMVNDLKSFACPSDPRMSYLFEQGSPLFSGTVPLTSCYGMNRFMLAAGAKKAKAPAAQVRYLKDPAHTVFIMDSVRPFVTPALLWKDPRNFRHENKGNYLFADGAVRHLDRSFFGKFEGEKFITDFTRWYWR